MLVQPWHPAADVLSAASTQFSSEESTANNMSAAEARSEDGNTASALIGFLQSAGDPAQAKSEVDRRTLTELVRRYVLALQTPAARSDAVLLTLLDRDAVTLFGWVNQGAIVRRSGGWLFAKPGPMHLLMLESDAIFGGIMRGSRGGLAEETGKAVRKQKSKTR
jgi:hypothetical protein